MNVTEEKDSDELKHIEARLESVELDNDVDDENERRLVKKIDRRILPIACLMYLFAFLDRSNLGNARLQGLPQDTLHGDPTGVLFDWVTSAFYLPYILLEVPAIVVSKLFPPRLWLGSAAIGWGLCSTLMSTAFNFTSLLFARLILAIFEVGFGPGIPLYMSFWYTKTEIGLRLASFVSFAAVAGAFGGLIAFGIQHADAAIADWRLLFIVEGIPAILTGFIALAFLPDRPDSPAGRFLTVDERRIALARMDRDISGDRGFVVNRAHVAAAFKDWRIYAGGVIFFSMSCALATLSAFLPTIIKTFGWTNAIAQLLTVPPYAVAAVVLTATSYASDRAQSRGLHITGSCALGGLGYLILLFVKTNIHVRYFATFCIASGTYTTIGLINAWYVHNLGSESKRAAGMPLFMAIGQGGSVLGAHIFPATEGPAYVKGFAISCGLEFLACLCALVLTLYGRPEPGTQIDTSELADKAPMFRYVP